MNGKSLLSLIAIISLSAVSCQKTPLDESVQVSNLPEGAIGFDPYVSIPTTKGANVSKDSIQNGGIGVFAFYQASVMGKPMPFNSRRYTTPDYMYNQKVTYDGSGWTYTPVKFWPNNEGDRLSFFGYAPYKSTCRWEDLGVETSTSSNKLSVTFSINDDILTQEDILWATPQINQSNKTLTETGVTTKTIPFNFKHITAKVDLLIGVTTASEADKWKDENTVIIPKSIIFENLNRQFRYTYTIENDILQEPAKVEYFNDKSFTLTVTPSDDADSISIRNWKWDRDGGILRDTLKGYHPFVPAGEHLFLSQQEFTDQTVTITYIVKTTDPNSRQNNSTITNTISRKLADILPEVESDSKGHGFQAGKAYSMKFLIGMDDIDISVNLEDWNANLNDKEIYVPANWTFTLYQGNNTFIGDAVNYSKFEEGDSIIINARETDLVRRNSKLFILKDYSAESIPLDEINEQRVAEAIKDSATGVLRFKDISDSLKDGIVKTKGELDNLSMMIPSKTVNDSIYVFEYTDTLKSIRRYAVIKVDSAKHTPALTIHCKNDQIRTDTTIREGDTLHVLVRENDRSVKNLPAAGFAITDDSGKKTDAFGFSVEKDTSYVFRASAGDTTGTRKIIVCGDTLKVKIKAYDFSSTEIHGSQGDTCSVTLLLGGVPDKDRINSNGFIFTGAPGLSIDSVRAGKVYVSASKDATSTFYGTLDYVNNGVIVATCIVDLGLKYTDGGYSGPSIWVPATGKWWAPVNCGYDAVNYRYGKLYQWGRKDGCGYKHEPPSDKDDAGDILQTASKVAPISPDAERSDIYYQLTGNDAPWDWITPQDDARWNSGTEAVPVKTVYDPCPSGWRVPTKAELNALIGGVQYNLEYFDVDTRKDSPMYNLYGRFVDGTSTKHPANGVFLPAGGGRGCTAGYSDNRDNSHNWWSGLYWHSTTTKDAEEGRVNSLRLGKTCREFSLQGRANGHSVRCVAEK